MQKALSYKKAKKRSRGLSEWSLVGMFREKRSCQSWWKSSQEAGVLWWVQERCTLTQLQFLCNLNPRAQQAQWNSVGKEARKELHSPGTALQTSIWRPREDSQWFKLIRIQTPQWLWWEQQECLQEHHVHDLLMILIPGLALHGQMLNLGFLFGLYANDVGFAINGSSPKNLSMNRS